MQNMKQNNIVFLTFCQSQPASERLFKKSLLQHFFHTFHLFDNKRLKFIRLILATVTIKNTRQKSAGCFLFLTRNNHFT
jgi:hypothetical protein